VKGLSFRGLGGRFGTHTTPRPADKMRSFCLCLYPKSRAAERDPQGVGARPHCHHGSPEVCGDVEDQDIGDGEFTKSLILV